MAKIIFLLIIILFPSVAISIEKIAIIVGTNAITDYEFDQRVRYIMFSQNIDPKQNKPSSLYGYFINTIIETELIVAKLKQNGAKITKEELDNGLKYISSARGITTDQMIDISYNTYGIHKQFFLDFTKDDMMTQTMFLASLSNGIIISEEEIIAELKTQNLEKNDENITKIRFFLIQKTISEKAKSIVESLRQSTLIDIKIKSFNID